MGRPPSRSAYRWGMSISPLVEPVARLSAAESARIVSHRGLPPLTEVDRRRLANARVLVLGAGRLGSPTLHGLAAAGVGTIGIVASDDIEAEAPPEAQPGIEPATDAAGSEQAAKRSGRHAADGTTDAAAVTPADTAATTAADTAADTAAEAAAEVAPEAAIIRHPGRLSPDNAFEILGGYDLVIDCADNFPAPFLANDTCAALGLPLVWGSVLHGDPQLSVFWAHPPAGSDVTGVHLRDLYPAPPKPDERPLSADSYVLGALSGQLGSLMVGEAIKLITGVGEPLLGRRLVIDEASGRFTETALLGTGVPAACPMPAGFAAPAGATASAAARPAISAAELVERMTARAAGTDAFLVVDVREPDEHAQSAVPHALLLPLARLLTPEGQAGLPRDVPLVLHCHHGTRADLAAAALREAGFTDVAVLSGGIVAWDDAVDDGTAPGRGSDWAETLSSGARSGAPFLGGPPAETPSSGPLPSEPVSARG